MLLALGPHHFDVRYRALVMGILNRTPDSFFDQGGYWDFDRFLAKAEARVDEGADFLDVGGVKAGPGAEVTEQEELDRVLPAIEALAARFDVPLSVDTWRASVARAAFAAGAVVGNDISGFADPDYLPAAAYRRARRTAGRGYEQYILHANPSISFSCAAPLAAMRMERGSSPLP